MPIAPFTLNSGNKIPGIAYGIGTKWYNGHGVTQKNPEITKGLDQAIKLGFTHLDVAEKYGNYPELKDSLDKADRSKLYITDKFDEAIEEPGHTPYPTLKATLKYLGIDYVDLYLIHSPFSYPSASGQTLKEAWAEMVKLKEEGLAKDIGVSNFAVEHLKELDPAPAVNEIEYSAYLQNQSPEVVEYCQKNNILVSAYGSLVPVRTEGPLLPYLEELSKKYNRPTGEILLRWDLQNGILPVTTSSSAERLSGFLSVGDFSLTDEEVKKINEIGATHKVRKFWNKQFD